MSRPSGRFWVSLPLTERIAGLAFLMAAYLDDAEKTGTPQSTTTTRVSLVTSAVGGWVSERESFSYSNQLRLVILITLDTI